MDLAAIQWSYYTQFFLYPRFYASNVLKEDNRALVHPYFINFFKVYLQLFYYLAWWIRWCKTPQERWKKCFCVCIVCVRHCRCVPVCASVADTDKSSHCATATCIRCFEEKQCAHDKVNVVTQWFVLQLGDFCKKQTRKHDKLSKCRVPWLKLNI